MRLCHSRNQILLQLLQLTAKDKRGMPLSLTVLLDTGSDCSYARQEVIIIFHRVVLALNLWHSRHLAVRDQSPHRFVVSTMRIFSLI